MTRLRFRRRYREAHLQSTAEAYHDWRKVTKRLHDQLRLCAAIDAEVSRPDRREVKAIGVTLGLHQDAEVLRRHFLCHAESLSAAERAEVLGLFEDWVQLYRRMANQQMAALLAGAHGRLSADGRQPPQLKVI